MRPMPVAPSIEQYQFIEGTHMKALSLRSAACLALALGSPLAHAGLVVWQVSGTVGYVYPDDNPQLPFPVSTGESVVLDMTVDTTAQGYTSYPGQESYGNVVGATMNVGGNVLSLDSNGETVGGTNIDYNSPFGTSQYLNGISMSAQNPVSKVEASWYLQTVGDLNATPINSFSMLQQPPALADFQTVGVEVWPYGDQYQFEFLASINNLAVTPVPLPAASVVLLGGLVFVFGTALRRDPRAGKTVSR
jgi:hypothetical protein